MKCHCILEGRRARVFPTIVGTNKTRDSAGHQEKPIEWSDIKKCEFFASGSTGNFYALYLVVLLLPFQRRLQVEEITGEVVSEAEVERISPSYLYAMSFTN